MSAIAGIIHFDRSPIDRSNVARVEAALTAFGPDSGRNHIGPDFALIYRGSHFTPEDRLDRQPLAMAGGRMLIFHGRIDNRPELLSSRHRSGW